MLNYCFCCLSAAPPSAKVTVRFYQTSISPVSSGQLPLIIHDGKFSPSEQFLRSFGQEHGTAKIVSSITISEDPFDLSVVFFISPGLVVVVAQFRILLIMHLLCIPNL